MKFKWVVEDIMLNKMTEQSIQNKIITKSKRYNNI